MDFKLLELRLLALLRTRVRNGEITERRLARLTGISQPHLHNVLKGARLLSLGMADQILGSLQINLLDLLEPGETICRSVPVLEGHIGPAHPYPESVGQTRYPFPAAEVDGLQAPVAGYLEADPEGPPEFNSAGVVLLDSAEETRLDAREGDYFALDLGNRSGIGRVRHADGGWLLWNHKLELWQPIADGGRTTLDLIKSRVRLLVRHF